MNVYELASKKSDISTQILYGEKFSVIGRKKVFLKIRSTIRGNKTLFYDR